MPGGLVLVLEAVASYIECFNGFTGCMWVFDITFCTFFPASSYQIHIYGVSWQKIALDNLLYHFGGLQ